jgi:hypothetical protein
MQMTKNIHEAMFNILNHKGNTNQGYTKIPSHSNPFVHCQEKKKKKKTNSKCWQGYWEKETLIHCW